MKRLDSVASRGLQWILIVAAASSLLGKPERASGAERESLDSYIKTQMTQRRIPGMAIAVIKQGKVELVRTYGKASLEFDVPVRRSTLFSVASITKSFTAVAVMKLVEAQQLTLEDPIGRHLPDLPPRWHEVTVRQLLNHTSGLPPDITDSYSARPIAQTRKEALEILAQRPLDFAPGSNYRYIGTNAMLLAMLIEAKSGKAFEHAAAELLFAPLKIAGPAFGGSREIIKERSTAYTPYRYRAGPPVQLNHLEVYDEPSHDLGYSGAGLNISIDDFAQWLAALLNGNVISRENLETIWAPTKLNDGSVFERPPAPSLWRRYGLGWVLGEHNGHAFAGGTGGIRCAFFVYPQDDLAVIVLTNSQGALPESLVQAISMRYLAGGKR